MPLAYKLRMMVVSRVLMGTYGFKIGRKDLKLDFEILIMILKVGVPSAIQQLVNSLGLLLVQSYANLKSIGSHEDTAHYHHSG